MELKSISRLADLMARHGLSELELSENGSTIRLCRPIGTLAQQALPEEAGLPPVPAPPAPEESGANAPAEEEEGRFITAPMVGTFFSAVEPDAPALISVGDSVTPETVVCVIEAMKVMNEIKAETSGVITKILVPNGSPVEFGQKLFELR